MTALDSNYDEVSASCRHVHPHVEVSHGGVLKCGKSFDENYQIQERLNVGGKGTVYKVIETRQALQEQQQQPQPGRQYAAKRIRRCGLREQDELDILSEVNILKSMSDVGNVVKFVEFYAEEGDFYIIQELANGGDLFDKVDRNELYTEHQARSVAIKLLQAVQTLHDRGVVHRDIKVENLILKDGNDCTSVLLADFGFATYMPNEGYLTRRCGTPSYTAPEVWQQGPYNQSVDMWGIGTVLYMIICGDPPFYANNNRELCRRICSGEVRFDAPIWRTISFEAKCFIMDLLTVDPLQRLTVDEALQSPWIQSGLTDALFDNLDWVPMCSQKENPIGVSYVYSIEPAPLKLG